MVDGWVARLASARPIPTAARWLSLATTVTAFFLIVFGSHVRVTESGMGCPDWPLCYGQAGPILEFHALMEQGHRYVAGLVSLLVCTTAAVMFWYRRSRPATLRPALFTLAMLVVQVLLGAVTVFAGNGSPTVALHLVAGLTLLGGSWVTTLCAFVPKVRAPGPRLAIIGWVAVTSVVLLLIAGSVIVDSGSEGLCASIPFCPVGNSTGQTLVHMVHRGMALLAAVAVWSFALHAWRHWSTVPRARAMAVVASALILGNAGIGTASALLMAPPRWRICISPERRGSCSASSVLPSSDGWPVLTRRCRTAKSMVRPIEPVAGARPLRRCAFATCWWAREQLSSSWLSATVSSGSNQGSASGLWRRRNRSR